jgi:Leucine-rich repeat (LRR) protein
MAKTTGTTRRSFLVMIGSTVIGSYLLPWLKPVAKSAKAVERSAGGEIIRRLVSPPKRWKSRHGFSLIWGESTSEGEKLMTWEPKTEKELAEAQRFYEDCRNWNSPTITSRPLPKRDPAEKRLIEAMLNELCRDDSTNYDPAPFYAYAELREKQGDPEGEFVRVCCRIDELPNDDPEVERLNDRWRELMDSWVPEHQFGPLRELGLQFEMFGEFFPALYQSTQGLIKNIDVDRPGIIPEQAERLFAFAPVLHSLKFTYDAVELARVAECPQLAQVSEITLGGWGLDLEGAKAFLRSPHLGRLTSLELSSDRLGPELGRALGSSSLLAQLRNLDIHGQSIGREGLSAILASPRCVGLTELNLSDNALDAEAIKVLAKSRNLRNLKVLSLADNSIDDESLAHLRQAAFLSKLAAIDLSFSNLGTEGINTLMSLRCLDALERLYLTRCGLSDEAIRPLWVTPALANLKQLRLDSNHLTTDSIVALSRSPHLHKLEELKLGENKLTGAAAKALAGSKNLTPVKELNLVSTNIGPAGVKALVGSPYLDNLKRLTLSRVDAGTVQRAVIDRFGEGVLILSDH